MTYAIQPTLALSELISPDGAYYSDPDFVNEEVFLKAYLNLTASQLIHLAHQPNAMIRKCEMRGIDANTKCQQLIKGAIKMFTPKHGVCYQLNGVHRDIINESLTVDNTGPDNGLILEMDVEGLKVYFPKYYRYLTHFLRCNVNIIEYFP